MSGLSFLTTLARTGSPESADCGKRRKQAGGRSRAPKSVTRSDKKAPAPRHLRALLSTAPNRAASDSPADGSASQRSRPVRSWSARRGHVRDGDFSGGGVWPPIATPNTRSSRSGAAPLEAAATPAAASATNTASAAATPTEPGEPLERTGQSSSGPPTAAPREDPVANPTRQDAEIRLTRPGPMQTRERPRFRFWLATTRGRGEDRHGVGLPPIGDGHALRSRIKARVSGRLFLVRFVCHVDPHFGTRCLCGRPVLHDNN